MFSVEWQTDFGDKIQSEANGDQFVAIRTRAKRNVTKGGFDTMRSTLSGWPPYLDWTVRKLKETKLASRPLSLPFISMDAQRDIHQDLRDKSSFIGRILAGVEYDKDDILALETMIKAVNDEAVKKSDGLKSLRSHLETLNQSIGGSGGAEITPFPKKMRDLSKNFSVYFGDSASNSFPMEYHGMGTRSWASMLTIKSFVEILANKHRAESEPFFPVLGVEEPEAHLHPNAQKTLFRQLLDINGQIILSTHSPFLAAVADIYQIRSLVKGTNGVVAHHIAREVLATKGEILFAKALLLCEGVTEAQVLPAMFELYTQKSPWNLGVSCVSVGGKNYGPYVRTAFSFGIPSCILSDNDGTTKSDVEKHLKRLEKDAGIALVDNLFGIYYLSASNDFEAEVMSHGLRPEIIDALVLSEINGSSNERYRNAKRKELEKLSDLDILQKMRDSKASYSGFLADVLLGNARSRPISELIPLTIRNAFDCIKGWL